MVCNTKYRQIITSRDAEIKLFEMAYIENISKEALLEKIILNYIPVPAIIKPGQFRIIPFNEIRGLRKINPFALIVNISPNSKVGLPGKLNEQYKLYHLLKNKEISWSEFRRKYIERLMLPDAQEEIARLKKMRTSFDVYITGSVDVNDEKESIRKLFVDYVNGDIIWK